jgi:hypothetical protein
MQHEKTTSVIGPGHFSVIAPGQLIAVLAKGHEIEVLVAEKPFGNQLYLVRTGFGLTGWDPLKADQYKPVDVEGLFYNND